MKNLAQANTLFEPSHGTITVGANLDEAFYRMVFAERAAAMLLNASAAVGGDVSRLNKVDETLAVEAQQWRMADGPVRAHSSLFFRQAIKNLRGDAINGDEEAAEFLRVLGTTDGRSQSFFGVERSSKYGR